jgi:hypothetical protein
MTDPGVSINASTATFSVIDEYGTVQPAGAGSLAADGTYSFTVPLEAGRKGSDRDGRRYQVIVSVEDNNGNLGTATAVVTVPHDQGKN